jgi:hypothetical protein
MNNIAQPFVNLTNSNVEAIKRFAQSPEISDLANVSAQKYLELAQKSFGAFPASGAHAELAKRLTENYSTFAQEYAQSLMSMATSGQNAMKQQFQDASDRVTAGAESAAAATANAADGLRSHRGK